MKNKSAIGRLVLLFCLIFQTVLAPARATTVSDCGGYSIFFGNGIMNTQDDYEDGRQALEDLFGTTYDGLPVLYGNAIDYTQGFWTDLLAVMHQEVDAYEEDGLTWTLAIQIFLGIQPEGTSLSLIDLMQQAVQQVINTAASALLDLFNDNEAHIADTVVEHVQLYEDAILDHNQRVLVVAHSQGTLYANMAYTTVMNNPDVPAKSMAIVDVAALVASVADGQNRYVTSSGDMAVASLRAVINSFVLPSNVDLPYNHDDILGHNFVLTYLAASSASESMIVNKSHQALDALENADWVVEQSLSEMRTTPNLSFVSPYVQWDENMNPIYTDAFLEYGWAGPTHIAQWGMAVYDYMFFTYTAQSEPIYGWSPSGSSQTYRNAKGEVVDSTAFAGFLNDAPFFYAIRGLEELAPSPANSSLPFTFLARRYGFPEDDGSWVDKSHAAIAIDTLGSTYDSEMLQPWTEWLKTNFPAVRSVKQTHDWPEKVVQIRVCPTTTAPEA